MDSVGSGCLHLTYKTITLMYNMFYAQCIHHFTPSMPRAFPGGSVCYIHYLYAEDLPQLVWIGFTTQHKDMYIYTFCARAIRALYARTRAYRE